MAKLAALGLEYHARLHSPSVLRCFWSLHVCAHGTMMAFYVVAPSVRKFFVFFFSLFFWIHLDFFVFLSLCQHVGNANGGRYVLLVDACINAHMAYDERSLGGALGAQIFSEYLNNVFVFVSFVYKAGNYCQHH
jgi:hypothetical protein